MIIVIIINVTLFFILVIRSSWQRLCCFLCVYRRDRCDDSNHRGCCFALRMFSWHQGPYNSHRVCCTGYQCSR